MTTIYFGSNVLEKFYPHDINIDFEQVIEDVIKDKFHDVYEKINQFGMSPKGQARVTRNLSVLG